MQCCLLELLRKTLRNAAVDLDAVCHRVLSRDEALAVALGLLIIIKRSLQLHTDLVERVERQFH